MKYAQAEMRHKVFTIVLLLLQFFCISTDSRISKVSKYMKHWPQISEKTLEQPVVMELNYRSMIYLKDAYYLSNNFTSVWGFKCLSLSRDEMNQSHGHNIIGLTLYLARSKIYIKQRGMFNTSLLFHIIMQFLVHKVLKQYAPKLEGPN